MALEMSESMRNVALSGFLQIGLSYALVFAAEQKIDSGLTAILFASFPAKKAASRPPMLRSIRPFAKPPMPSWPARNCAAAAFPSMFPGPWKACSIPANWSAHFTICC